MNDKNEMNDMKPFEPQQMPELLARLRNAEDVSIAVKLNLDTALLQLAVAAKFGEARLTLLPICGVDEQWVRDLMIEAGGGYVSIAEGCVEVCADLF